MPGRFAVIGLGSMGYGMAQSCLAAGHSVFGIDTRQEVMGRLRTEGAETGEPSALDAAIIVVLNAEQSEEAITAILPHVAEGGVIIACATVPPDHARKMAATADEHGVHYLDAPISGGSVKAAQGELTIMAAGSAEAFLAADAALNAMAETVFQIGSDAGAGSAMKAVNQLLAGVHIATMAEAMTFGMTQGIAPETFMEVIPSCAGSSWMLANRGPHIVDGDYTPHSQVTIWPKDLGIVQTIAEDAGFDAPITRAALARYQEAVARGLGAEDDAAVAKVYAQDAGLTLPGDQG